MNYQFKILSDKYKTGILSYFKAQFNHLYCHNCLTVLGDCDIHNILCYQLMSPLLPNYYYITLSLQCV